MKLKKLFAMMLAAALCVSAAALAGCHKWSVADLETQPGHIRIDGVEALAATITEDMEMGYAEDAAVLATLNRGDAVEYVADNGEGMACIRLAGTDGEPVVAFVDARFVELDTDTPYAEWKGYALTDARSWADFWQSTGETVIPVNAAFDVVDEIDGILVAYPAGMAGAKAVYLPAWVLAKAEGDITSRVDAAPVHAGYLNRDDEVVILGEADGYTVIAYEGEDQRMFCAFVPSWLVRPASEAAPETREGYCTYNAYMYTTAFMDGGAQGLDVDTIMTVLDEFGGVAFVKAPDGSTGYMPANQVTDTPNYREPVRRPSAPAPSGPQDGGDISLTAFTFGAVTVQASWVAGISADDPAVIEFTAEQLDGAPVVTGKILSDETPVYWMFLDRGEAIHKAEPKGDAITDGRIWVQLAGRIGWMTDNLVRTPQDAAFTSADLFAQEGAILFSDYTRESGVQVLSRNDKIHVVDEYGEGFNCYVIEVTDGFGNVTTVYTGKGNASDTEIPEPVRRPSYGGGGGGAPAPGGSSGGGPEWTDPVL